MDEDQAYRAMDLLVEVDAQAEVQEAVFFAVANLRQTARACSLRAASAVRKAPALSGVIESISSASARLTISRALLNTCSPRAVSSTSLTCPGRGGPG
jgi:hypothetical protein